MGERSEDLPLKGISVLVTRVREQSAGLLKDLTARGADVTVIPAVSISPLLEPEGLARAMGRIGTYDNVIFTSANGVAFTLQLLEREGINPQDLPPALCVGEKTAGVWKDAGGRVEAVPEQYTAEALLATLGEDLAGRSFLVMRPEVVKTELGQALSLRGAAVEEIVIYRTAVPDEGSKAVQELLAAGKPDAVFFASPSAIDGILSMAAQSPKPKVQRKSSAEGEGREVQGEGRRAEGEKAIKGDSLQDTLLAIPAICIGPTTARAAEEAGFTEVYFPNEHTAEGMVNELMVIAGALKKKDSS